MKKKHGFLFLGLGLLLVVLFLVFKYTNIISSLSNNGSIQKDETLSYDYVKSRDLSTKTKVSYPVDETLSIYDYYSSDFYKFYTNDDGLTLTALINSDYPNLNDKFYNDKVDENKKNYEASGKIVKTTKADCKYLCTRMQVYENDSLYLDEYKIYYKLYGNTVFELTYRSAQKELSDDLIDAVNNNLVLSNDATYTFSKISGNDLVITLKGKDGNLIIKVDNEKYEEVIDKNNCNQMTTLRNKQNSNELTIQVQFKKNNTSLLDELVQIFDTDYINQTQVDDIKVYEYDIDELKAYAIMIDDEEALIISPKNGIIDIKDFTIIKNEDT